MATVNGIIYRPGISVGEISAEDDDAFLNECFVEQSFFQQLLDMESPKSIILGRTGSGKTAILKHIESTRDDVIRIDPKEIAFEYISNSNIIQFILDVGCDINLLFQLLWKHILLSKSIKKYFSDRGSFEVALDAIFDRGNPAIAYIEKYQDTFWIEHDTILKEMSEQFQSVVEDGIEGTLGPERLASIKAASKDSYSVSAGEKREIQSRVKQAVSGLQVREMGRAIESLNRLMSNKQRHFYVLIDDLDLDWAEPSIQNRLIQALVETVKTFRKLRNVKVLVALRADVYEKAISGYAGEGIQPEKYDGITIVIRWDKISLKNMIDRRIAYMFTRQYSRKDVIRFSDVFPESVRSSNGFDYISERTMMRPRDLIAFVNMILEKASGTTAITQKTISDVEAAYSRKRLDALKIEWRSVHPTIDSYISLLNRQTGKNGVKELATRDAMLDVCIELTELEGKEGLRDECFLKAQQYSKRENPKKLFELTACVLSVLYKIGAIELKLSKQETYYASYRNDAVIDAVQITEEAAYRVTPMLWRALGITPNL
ncbi:P-loop ATPase, Sll1717 family [Hoeflea alexandrii]